LGRRSDSRGGDFRGRRGGGIGDGGGDRGPTGAELRLKNKENRTARQQGKAAAARSAGGGGGAGGAPARGSGGASQATAQGFSGDDDDEGWSIPGEKRKGKRTPSKGGRRSVAERAKEGLWVGNRAALPRPPAADGE
jgi:hypothetical protein